MNPSELARLYGRLTVWERIPLLIAAEARGDHGEVRRLFDTSPQRTCRLSEYLLAEQVVHVLALIYVGEQLDAAASYFFALWRMDDDADRRPEGWLLSAQACAYFFAANADAWRRFCGGLGIAPEALTAANHRGWFLPYCEEQMPAHAPTAEALHDRLRRTIPEAARLVTADDLLASWRSLLRAMTRHAPRWAGEGEG